MTTISFQLSEGRHTIRVSKLGYDTLIAEINVGKNSVSCVSVNGVIPGRCGQSTAPGVVTSGWNVTVSLKETTAATGYDEWLASKGGLVNIKLSDIFELKDEFVGLTDILDFEVTLPQIMECKDAFVGLI